MSLKNQVEYCVFVLICLFIYLNRFYEAIIHTRKLKVTLERIDNEINVSSNTTLVWLRSIHTHVKLKMDLIFDRIQSCSVLSSEKYNLSTRESLNEQTFQQQSDVKNDIGEFLWKHHQKSRQLATFAIILDAGRTQPTFEKGFMVMTDQSQVVDGLRSWPAVFIRSNRCLMRNENDTQFLKQKNRRKNLHSIDESNMNSVSRQKGDISVLIKEDRPHRRIMTAQADLASYVDRKTSLSMILDAVTDGGKTSDINIIESERHREYWLANSQWPNSMWHNLVSLLVEYRKTSCIKTTTFRDLKPDDQLDTQGCDSLTAYHFVRVAECMWLALMVREDNYKHKHKLQSDEEINYFMNEMAAKLRFGSLLRQEAIEKARYCAESYQGMDDDVVENDDRRASCFFC